MTKTAAVDTTLTVKPSQASSIIAKALRAHLVPMMHGSPGIGKSSIVHELAAQFNLKVIDLRLSQCDPTDLLGFPRIDEAKGKAGYVPMDTFPIEGDELPIKIQEDTTRGITQVKYDGWLLFLDELPIAPPAVQAAAYKLILDRMVGNHHLHERVMMVAAGNLESDNALVHPMSTALQSRMMHLVLELDVQEWLSWARNKGLDFRITSYIGFRPEVIYTFKPDHTDKTYACPRTWEFADRALKAVDDMTDPDLLPLLAGNISEGVAREFLTFCQIEDQIPKIKDIVLNPKGTKVPQDLSVLFMLSGSLGVQATKDNLTEVHEYVMRMPAEFQVITLREIIRRNQSLMSHPSITKWIAHAGAKLF